MDNKEDNRSALDKFIDFITNFKLIMVAFIILIIIHFKM